MIIVDEIEFADFKLEQYANFICSFAKFCVKLITMLISGYDLTYLKVFLKKLVLTNFHFHIIGE